MPPRTLVFVLAVATVAAVNDDPPIIMAAAPSGAAPVTFVGGEGVEIVLLVNKSPEVELDQYALCTVFYGGVPSLQPAWSPPDCGRLSGEVVKFPTATSPGLLVASLCVIEVRTLIQALLSATFHPEDCVHTTNAVIRALLADGAALPGTLPGVLSSDVASAWPSLAVAYLGLVLPSPTPEDRVAVAVVPDTRLGIVVRMGDPLAAAPVRFRLRPARPPASMLVCVEQHVLTSVPAGGEEPSVVNDGHGGALQHRRSAARCLHAPHAATVGRVALPLVSLRGFTSVHVCVVEFSGSLPTFTTALDLAGGGMPCTAATPLTMLLERARVGTSVAVHAGVGAPLTWYVSNPRLAGDSIWGQLVSSLQLPLPPVRLISEVLTPAECAAAVPLLATCPEGTRSAARDECVLWRDHWLVGRAQAALESALHQAGVLEHGTHLELEVALLSGSNHNQGITTHADSGVADVIHGHVRWPQLHAPFRAFAASLLLSNEADFHGGEFGFVSQPATELHLSMGAMLAFSGGFDSMHCVRRITAGKRVVLLTWWRLPWLHGGAGGTDVAASGMYQAMLEGFHKTGDRAGLARAGWELYAELEVTNHTVREPPQMDFYRGFVGKLVDAVGV